MSDIEDVGTEDVGTEELGITEELESTNNLCKELGTEQDFCDAIINAKYSLYENIIISPELGTPKSQDLALNDEFKRQLQVLFTIIMGVINTNNTSINLDTFPEGSRIIIKNAINVSDKYKNQTSAEFRNKYTSYIINHLHDYPFILKDV